MVCAREPNRLAVVRLQALWIRNNDTVVPTTLPQCLQRSTQKTTLSPSKGELSLDSPRLARKNQFGSFAEFYERLCILTLQRIRYRRNSSTTCRSCMKNGRYVAKSSLNYCKLFLTFIFNKGGCERGVCNWNGRTSSRSDQAVFVFGTTTFARTVESRI